MILKKVLFNYSSLLWISIFLFVNNRTTTSPKNQSDQYSIQIFFVSPRKSNPISWEEKIASLLFTLNKSFFPIFYFLSDQTVLLIIWSIISSKGDLAEQDPMWKYLTCSSIDPWSSNPMNVTWNVNDSD